MAEPWAYESKLSRQYIEKLREFVKRTPAKKTANTRDPWVRF
jgi:hypothetical protein